MNLLSPKWGMDEIKLLKEMREDNKTNEEMARVLNRSYSSISHKLHNIGLSRPRGTNHMLYNKQNPMKGKKHSEETKEKIRERAKQILQNKDKHPNWKGGVILNHNGYILVRMSNHPNANNGYVFEHILIMENILGRYLEREECIHHINGIRNDNNPNNLMLFRNSADHNKYHAFFNKKEILECLTL